MEYGLTSGIEAQLSLLLHQLLASLTRSISLTRPDVLGRRQE